VKPVNAGPDIIMQVKSWAICVGLFHWYWPDAAAPHATPVTKERDN